MRGPATIVVTALVLLGMPTLGRAATITDIGSYTGAWAVNSQQEVLLFGNRIWDAGTVIGPPKAPATDPTATFHVGGSYSLNDSGVVVGSVTTGGGETVPGYWDSATSDTFTELSLGGLTVDGEPAVTGLFSGIDASGEAVGAVEAATGSDGTPIAGLYAPAVGGSPTGQMQVVSSVDGTTIIRLTGISAGYELGTTTNATCPAATTAVLIDRSAGTATPTNLDGGASFANNGDLAGLVPGALCEGLPYLRLADGSETALQTVDGQPGDSSVDGVNSAAVTVGHTDALTQDGGFATQIWSPAGIRTPLLSVFPADSGWTLAVPEAINDLGDIVGFGTFDGNATDVFLDAEPNTKVSGAVTGVSCSDSVCKSGDASGFTVLVKGTSSAGGAVSATAVTADDGTWSVAVPAGSYQAGLSSDGSTLASTAFEQDLTVGSSALTGVNFTACDEGASDADSAASVSRRVGAHAAGRSRSEASTTNFVPGYCKSLYTFKLSASIPQSQIVDPSLKAPFNSSTDPNNPHYSGSTSVRRFLYQSGFDSLFEAYPEYPSCLDPEELVDLGRTATKVKWYTYMTGGSSLGKISIPIVWNQNTGDADQPQQVVYDPADEPSSSNGSLTRVWRFIIYPSSGAPVNGSCKLTVPITPRYFYIPGGSDDASRTHGPTSFTIVALWYFPFDPAGEVVPPDTSAEKLIKKLIGEEHGEQLVTAFEKMPWPLRFATTYALASGVAKVAEGGLAGVNAITEGLNATEKTLASLKSAASVPEVLHNGHTRYDVGVGMLEGLMGEGHYPVMGAVIRGNFTTTTYVHNASLNQQIPVAETLGLSVKSTSFPDISLTVSRDALAGTSSSPVWSGPLPWSSGAGSTTTAEPFTQNPFGSNPTGLIAHTTKQYLRGRDAVLGIISATSELHSIGEDVAKTGDLEKDFDKEQKLAPGPGCSNLGIPTTASTICWKFEDTRP